MTDMVGPVSLPEAARRLGLTLEATFDLVFTRRLRSVESETGRRFVPAEVIADRLSDHQASA